MLGIMNWVGWAEWVSCYQRRWCLLMMVAACHGVDMAVDLGMGFCHPRDLYASDAWKYHCWISSSVGSVWAAIEAAGLEAGCRRCRCLVVVAGKGVIMDEGEGERGVLSTVAVVGEEAPAAAMASIIRSEPHRRWVWVAATLRTMATDRTMKMWSLLIVNGGSGLGHRRRAFAWLGSTGLVSPESSSPAAMVAGLEEDNGAPYLGALAVH
ncbi:hypothetical protein ACLOJK_030697 [Asimina triloba]